MTMGTTARPFAAAVARAKRGGCRIVPGPARTARVCPTASAGEVRAPSGTASGGSAASRTSAAFTASPAGTARSRTTAGVVGGGVVSDSASRSTASAASSAPTARRCHETNEATARSARGRAEAFILLLCSAGQRKSRLSTGGISEILAQATFSDFAGLLDAVSLLAAGAAVAGSFFLVPAEPEPRESVL